jgi:16S rRNA (cytosine1402-N4)-methyltransferase
MGIRIQGRVDGSTMDIGNIHTPVMLARTIELLEPAITPESAVLVDATLGMGGHSAALLERFPGLHVVGLDRDPEALAVARERLAGFADRVRLVHTVYDAIDEVLRRDSITEVAGVLFDLGVSSMQLDRTERGFAYARDAPLDMRMDPSSGRTAADVIASADEAELRRIFSDYGEEKLAARYARAIVRARDHSPITSSAALVSVLSDATPAAIARTGHPAKRVFQALRIEVNEELDALRRALPAALETLAVGGRIVVLAYQSLEDRIVKRELQRATSSSAPAGLPVELPEHRPQFRPLVRGAELASQDEQAENPRARPVRLRAAERMRRAA